LAFARKQVIVPRLVMPNAVLLSLEPILQRLVGANIRLELQLEPELGLLKIDPSQLEQVLMNMVVNARDAMPVGGSVILETSNVVLSGAEPDSLMTPQGEYVLISVRDTGAGMAEETQKRLFEPFFTTKELGKGTGLGLAMCHGIVHQNGGHIGFTSRLGQGTTFKVYLPRVMAALDDVPQPVVPLPQGSETILLVEGEPLVRNHAAQVLRGCGYTVLEAESGEEALERVASCPLPIDLLMLDVALSHIKEGRLDVFLGATQPEMKVLFVSGLSETYAREASSLPFLRKPFRAGVLARGVRERLDGEPPHHQSL
jgi:CheY-like chemotaxis protein